jgi:hypothetical protein
VAGAAPRAWHVESGVTSHDRQPGVTESFYTSLQLDLEAAIKSFETCFRHAAAWLLAITATAVLRLLVKFRLEDGTFDRVQKSPSVAQT